MTAAPTGADDAKRPEPVSGTPAPSTQSPATGSTVRIATDGIEVAHAAGRALLGAALLAESAADVVIEVEPAAWPTSDLRSVALAIAQLRAAGRPVDPITVAEQLHRVGEPVGLENLAGLMNETPSISLAPYYAEIVGRHRRDRQLVELADQLGRAALEGQDVGPIVARIVEVAG